MVDLHCHILPGLDDGARTIDDALEMARAAAGAGIARVVATPHIRDDHPFALELMDERLGTLREALVKAEIPVKVARGGEVALSKIAELDDETLTTLCIGMGHYLLVESPHTEVTGLLERVVFELQSRGFRPLLAHPERSPSLLRDLPRLERLVERGVLCSVTAGSMQGKFGTTVQRFTAELFAAGLVHNVASDSHDSRRRPPSLREGFWSMEQLLPGLGDQSEWFTADVPSAILSGRELPTRPAIVEPRPRGLRRLLVGAKRAA